MPESMPETADLVSALAAAAADAVRNERPSLTYDPGRLRGVVVELEISGSGVVVDGRAWVERQVRPRRREAR